MCIYIHIYMYYTIYFNIWFLNNIPIELIYHFFLKYKFLSFCYGYIYMLYIINNFYIIFLHYKLFRLLLVIILLT